MCAWCNEKIREFGGKPGMAHGICPDCRAKFFPETLRTVQENAQSIVWDCLRAIGGASAVLLLLLVLGVPCFAADTAILPDKPQPQTAVRVADKGFWIEAGTMAGAWTADTVSTHDYFARYPAGREMGYLFPGSRSTAKVMGAWAAVDVGAAVAAYEWKKHVRNRYLHPLWHVFMVQRIEAHSEGALGNFTH